jgi:hypothetical protein
MVTLKALPDGTLSDACMYSAIRAYEATPTAEWDTEVGRAGRQLEAQSADLTGRLRSQLETNELVLVVGAGVSASCGLPSWSALIDSLIVKLLANGELHADEARSILGAVTFRNNPLALTQALTSVVTEDRLRSAVEQEISQSAFKRSSLLRAVGDVLEHQHRLGGTPTTVLSFNYDLLIERELGERGVPVVALGRGAELSDLRDGAVNCWHLHGMVRDDEPLVAGDDAIVLTEASYGDAYLRAGQDPLSVLLDENRTALFVGFSFNDTYVREILLRASKSAGRSVAAGLVPEESLVEKGRPQAKLTAKKIREQLDRAGNPSHNLRAGADRRVSTRNKTIDAMPFWFSRWVLHAIGVEWWQVPGHRQVPNALRSLVQS